jgi:D-alanine--poly(phosphoribitol) ligase subunit 1
MAFRPLTENLLWPAFTATVQRRASAVALDFGTSTVSFQDLERDALRAAALLRHMGVVAGDVVALQLPKRASTYALLLGCLRLGAIYAPLDPRNPATRTAAVLARIRPKVLVGSVGSINQFGATLSPRGDGEFDSASWPAPLSRLPGSDEPQQTPESPAYIMHTSGSTGEPKGAVIPQQGIRSLMRWSAARLGAADQQCFTALNPLHFDNSVFDVYCGLVAGATILPIETSEVTEPDVWVRRISAGRASVMFTVPTLLLLLEKAGLLTPQALPDIRTFVFGGEGFPVESLKVAHARFRDRARLINVYGPTETSCICSSLEIDDAALAEINGPFASLGRMHTDFAHIIADQDGRPVGQNQPGELWIGGPNVGLGYYGNPEESARRFRQHPWQTNFRAIYYRTGDLVREDARGNLWFQGRADNQIKIAGHRVELEEIDAAVEAYPGISRALTVLVGRDSSAELVTAFESRTIVEPSALATAIAGQLPAYMRPARLLQVPSMPLNASGKADRRAIHALVSGLGAASAAPSTADAAVGTHARVRQAWRLALGHDAFADTDSFFDLGGTSIALTRVHAALTADRNDALSLLDLFANPTVARTVVFLDRGPVAAHKPVNTAQDRARQQQAALARAKRLASGAGP